MKKKQTITNDWWLERKNRDMWRSCSGEWQNEWPAQSMYSAKCMPLQSNPTDTMFTETGKIKLIIQTLCQPYENTLHRVKMMYYSTNKFIKWDHNKTALYILGTTVPIFCLLLQPVFQMAVSILMLQSPVICANTFASQLRMNFSASCSNTGCSDTSFRKLNHFLPI